jgi:hypothetical protein
MADDQGLPVSDAQGPFARADLLGALQDKAKKRSLDGCVLSGRSREPQEMQAAWGVREGALRAAFPIEQSRYMIQNGFVGHAFLLVS